MKSNIVLDILSFLNESIKFQREQFYLASSFSDYSIFVYLFLYTHMEELKYLGLNIIDYHEERKYVVD